METGGVRCPHADRCAGCPGISLPYRDQLANKRARVKNACGGYPDLAPLPIAAIVPADPPTGYRTRAKLMVARGDPAPRIGLFARGGGHIVVDIPECRVLSAPLAEAADAVRAVLAHPPPHGGSAVIPFGDDGRGALRAIDLREVVESGAARVLVTLVVQAERCPDRACLEVAAEALLSRCPRIIGVAANLHQGNSPQILGQQTILLRGVSSARDRIGSAYHLATYGSFVQAHRQQAAAIHDVIASAVGRSPGGLGGTKVLDLYGGSGALALSLSAAGARVHLVESFEAATQQALRAAHEQGFAHLSVQCADVASAVRGLVAAGESFDAVIANPPRRGIAPLARASIAGLSAPTLVYVSCDPDTLARDLEHFARLGYAATTLHPFDMIPQSDEVETVAVLRRATPASPTIAHEDDEVLWLEKGPHEPIAGEGSLLERALPSLAGGESVELVVLDDLDPRASGLVGFARDPSSVEAWRGALSSSSARRIYLALAKGVMSPKGGVTRALDRKPGAPLARTRYRRLAVVGGHSLVRVTSDERSPDQIRRHLAAIGHPILGDGRFGHLPSNRHFEEKYGLDRLFLHAVRVEVEHPRTGLRRIVEARAPGDLRAVMTRLGGLDARSFLDPKTSPEKAQSEAGVGPRGDSDPC